MEQILPANDFPKETVAAIMMLYKNTKVKECSPDKDTDQFDIVAGEIRRDTLAPYLYIICLDCVLRTSIVLMKENDFKLSKERSRKYPAQTIKDTEYGNDRALLANSPTQAESTLHSLERSAAGIGLHVNADKTEYMCFNQRGDIKMLNGDSLKRVNKFTSFESSVSSTKNDITTRLAKPWTVFDSLSFIWKLDQTNKIKCIFCKQHSCQNNYIDAPHGG